MVKKEVGNDREWKDGLYYGGEVELEFVWRWEMVVLLWGWSVDSGVVKRLGLVFG